MEILTKSKKNISNDLFFLDPNPGGSKAVFLLHGLGADSESWMWQMTALANAGYRPVVLDLPGFGKTPRPTGRWTIAGAARAVFDTVEQLEIDHLSIAGISMGGTVALKFALEYPKYVDHLILINTFASLRPQSFQDFGYFLRRFLLVSTGDRQTQAEFVGKRIFPKDGQEDLRRILVEKILQSDQKVYKEAMTSLGLFQVMGRLLEIKIPTLVITGGNDTTVPLHNQVALASGIRNARHVIIPDGGHGVTIDHPDEVNATLLSFLAE
jgi:3-oxoadipate enol-lactonase